MGEKQIASGGVIFREGDTADAAYIIKSGKVDLLELSQGRDTLIISLEAGKAFGELALADPLSLRPYTARVAEDSTLVTVTEEEFRAALSQSPPSILPFLTLALEKLKPSKSRKMNASEAINETDLKKITIAPATDKMKELFPSIEVTAARLPFRIGGYPEGGEVTRRDRLHLAIPAQTTPLRVSRQHCEISIENEGLMVTDLGSRFNTIVNGMILGRGRGEYSAPLKKGRNEVTLGAVSGPYKLTITCE